ncbi:extracellular solute-binding protein [Kitasatospora sp. GAS204B]|uniref:extracellular solute-binding protein n=1 Tax=unclassified Kitasatospora TaxID=2633591 RepID=UPI002474F22C|nr:extracellular solute-binding protein [Kitasatospora sp. GAS204B]MDH6116406.1 N,N'-diacetylchitobiose transport system substrate-binding protein [Kitasatospora sp. GAS204B]
MKRQLIAAVGVAAMVVGVAACGSSGKSGDSAGKPANYNGKTVTAWLMDGSAPQAWQDGVKADFATQFPGAKLNIQIQKWDGVGAKITTGLSDNSVDVLEVGNTQTAGYASTGGLMDLTSAKADLGGSDWAANLNASSVLDGKQYAAPWYFSNRVVIYNKALWTKAGITGTPKTLDEFYADLDKLKATQGVSQPIYLPGQEWYTYFGLIAGEGGQIAKQNGSAWAGNLESAEAKDAFGTYTKLQSYSTAPKDKDEATPPQTDVFSKGDVGAMIGLGWEAPAAKDMPADNVGYFPLPGKTADKPSGVFLGGSNLAVAQDTKNPDLAKGLLKIMLSDKYESMMASSGLIPNKTSLNSLATTPFAQAAIAASANGATTPNLANWTSVENPPSPIKEFMTAVLQGADYDSTAKKYDDQITTLLGQKQ